MLPIGGTDDEIDKECRAFCFQPSLDMPNARRKIRDELTAMYNEGLQPGKTLLTWEMAASLMEEHDPHRHLRKGEELAEIVFLSDSDDTEY